MRWSPGGTRGLALAPKDWEKDVLCHPHAPANDPIRCKGSLIPGRWTVTETIPVEE